MVGSSKLVPRDQGLERKKQGMKGHVLLTQDPNHNSFPEQKEMKRAVELIL